jgi:periplasmic divalent cation tolerance protein
LFIKTKASLFPEVEAAVRALHPYAVPEIIAVPVAAGSSPYLDWIAVETKDYGNIRWARWATRIVLRWMATVSSMSRA